MTGINKGFNPMEVISPRARWQLIDVLHEDEWWSMALGRWYEGEWRPVLVQRWNGGEGSNGNPTSRGFPTWFVLPDDTYSLYLNSKFIPDEKRTFVKAILGL